MIEIYHNSRCKKSRAGLRALESITPDFKIIEYLKEDAFTIESLTAVLIKLSKHPDEIIRKQEAIYKSNFKGRNFNETEWVKILVENPKLIQRPIVVKDEKAILGDPVEQIALLFTM